MSETVRKAPEEAAQEARRERARRSRAFAFFRVILRPFMYLRFRYTCDDLRAVEGPYLLLSNHNTDLDPIFIGIAARRSLRFVASEHIMRKGFVTWFLTRYFAPILHTKGRAGLSSTRNILRAIRDGEGVVLFPEGNRSFHGVTGEIPPVTGRLARRTGAKLVTFRLEGGYLTQPRWGTTMRRGKLTGRLVHVYSAEELHDMTDEQVTEAIRRDLYENAYALPEEQSVSFRGKHFALGMESALFACPACGAVSTLTSDDSGIRCTCGFSASLTPAGFLLSPDGTVRTLPECDALQRSRLAELTAGAPDDETVLFSDHVTASRIGTDHAVEEARTGTLAATRSGFRFDDLPLAPADIDGAAIYSRNTLVAHVGEESVHWEITGDLGFSALKYLYLYRSFRPDADA